MLLKNSLQELYNLKRSLLPWLALWLCFALLGTLLFYKRVSNQLNFEGNKALQIYQDGKFSSLRVDYQGQAAHFPEGGSVATDKELAELKSLLNEKTQNRLWFGAKLNATNSVHTDNIQVLSRGDMRSKISSLIPRQSSAAENQSQQNINSEIVVEDYEKRPAWLAMSRNGRQLLLRGQVADDTSRQALSKAIQKQYSKLEINNQLSVSATAIMPEQSWQKTNFPQLGQQDFVAFQELGRPWQRWNTTLGLGLIRNALRVALPNGESTSHYLPGLSYPEADQQNKRIVSPAQQILSPPSRSSHTTSTAPIRIGPIFFALGKAQGSLLNEERQRAFLEIKESLSQYPQSYLEISGHTCNLGDRSANFTLSRKRALDFAYYLAKKGLNPQRIVSVGMGPSQPLTSNEIESGRQKNRRIEFTIKQTQP